MLTVDSPIHAYTYPITYMYVVFRASRFLVLIQHVVITSHKRYTSVSIRNHDTATL